MRVVWLTHVFPRAAADPLGAFLLHLGEAYGERAQVHVVAPHAPGLARQENFGAIRVTRFRYAPEAYETLAYTGVMHERVRTSRRAQLLFSSLNLAFFLSAWSIVRHHRADVIHAHWWLPGGLIGAWVSQLTRVPLVITTHGTDVEELCRARGVMPLARFAFGRARAITCGSTYLRAQLLELNLTTPARVSVIPMPVSPRFADHRPDAPTRTRDSMGNMRVGASSPTADRRAIHILTVARLTAQKSIDTLIDAVAHVRARGLDARLRIVGDGDQRAALERRAREAGLAEYIEFLGMCPPNELPQLYAACDAFVLPSVREGMGLVLVEALLCGAPVIATDSGGVTDIVREGETGLLFPERDAGALARALERYARDPALAARLAGNGRAWVLERFTPARVAAQFLQVYESVLRA